MAPAVRERIESIDTEVSGLKQERTGVNRDVKTFAGFVDTMAKQLDPDDLTKYAEPVDVTALMEKQQVNAQLIEKAKTVRAAVAQRTEQLAAIPARQQAVEIGRMAAQKTYEKALEDAKKEYARLVELAKQDLATVTETLDKEARQIEADRQLFTERKANGEQWLAKYEANNPEKTDVPALLAQAEAHNKRYHVVCQYKEKKHQYDAFKAKAEQMDARIDALAKERADLIANAELPIAGLSFTDDGLELNGVPFVPGKVSDSQTMEIAAKLVIASNPTVKVFRIARGESLGAKRLQTIVDIARKNGFQGFIEQVQRGQDEMLVEEYTER